MAAEKHPGRGITQYPDAKGQRGQVDQVVVVGLALESIFDPADHRQNGAAQAAGPFIVLGIAVRRDEQTDKNQSDTDDKRMGQQGRNETDPGKAEPDKETDQGGAGQEVRAIHPVGPFD